MARVVVLDTGPLGMVTHPRRNADAKEWLQGLLRTDTLIRVPEIADYELRRELLRVNARVGIARLDALIAVLGYVALTTETMRRAAAFWADARRQGRPTADDKALDGDVILAAQVALLREGGDDAVIATANTGHLARFVPAFEWHQIR
jgi:toxin FitB